MPRKRSTKTVAEQPQREQRRARGWSAPGRSTRPTIRTATSTITKTLTSSQKPSRTSGNGFLEDAPGEERFADHRPAGAGQDPGGEAAEDDDAWRRRRSPARAGAWRRFAASRSRRRSLMTAVSVKQPRILTSAGDGRRRPLAPAALVQFGGAGGLAHPALGDLLPARRSSRSSSTALETQAVSGEPLASRAPHSSPPGALNWPTTVGVGNLGGGQVERRRQVDDDRVDLFVLQRRDDVVGAVEDFRLAARGRSLLRPRSRLVVPIWTPILASFEVGQRGWPWRRRSPSARRPPGWRCSTARRSRPPFRAAA